MDVDSLLPDREDKDSDEDDDNDDEEDDDDEENELEMRTYTVGELLGHTVQSYKDRGWDNDENSDNGESSSGSRDENNQLKKPGKRRGSGEKKKRQCRRVWTPDGEYTLVKTGPPLLMENPDDCIADMSHLSLTIFKHTDPDVRFGEDPDRPLWKGVFRMAVGGYGKDEYYDPKHSHLKRIYSVDFPKNKRPANNLQIRRDGVTELPYWVDAWHHAKLAEEGYKQKSKKKTQEKGRMQALKGDVITVVPPVENVIFPLVGWFKTNLAKRAKIPDPSGGYPYTLALPAETAKKSVKLVKDMIAKLGPVGTQPIAPPPPPAPAPSLKKERVLAKEALREEDSQEPLQKKTKKTPAPAAATQEKKKKKKRKEKPVEDEEEEEEEEKTIKKKAKPDAHENARAPVAQTQFSHPDQVVHQPNQMIRPVNVPDSNQKAILETMQAFFNAASAGMAAPGTFYYQALCEQQASFDSFFGPGGPADCVIPIVQMLLKKIGNK